jgi:hypothetical protein
VWIIRVVSHHYHNGIPSHSIQAGDDGAAKAGFAAISDDDKLRHCGPDVVQDFQSLVGAPIDDNQNLVRDIVPTQLKVQVVNSCSDAATLVSRRDDDRH